MFQPMDVILFIKLHQDTAKRLAGVEPLPQDGQRGKRHYYRVEGKGRPGLVLIGSNDRYQVVCLTTKQKGPRIDWSPNGERSYMAHGVDAVVPVPGNLIEKKLGCLNDVLIQQTVLTQVLQNLGYRPSPPQLESAAGRAPN